MTDTQALMTIENDRDYWQLKGRVRGNDGKIRKLDEWTQRYCNSNSLPFAQFHGSALYQRWDSDLYQERNRAVHAGVNTFSYDEASVAIGVAKECVVSLEARIPGISDKVQLNPSMSGFRQNAGEVAF